MKELGINKENLFMLIIGCLFVNFFLDSNVSLLRIGALVFVTAIVVIIDYIMKQKGYNKITMVKNISITMVIYSSALYIILFIKNRYAQNNIALAVAAVIFILIFFYVFMKLVKCCKDKKYSVENVIKLILVVAFFIRVTYLICTNVYTTQNDAGSFATANGHLGYIWYIYNHFHLPHFDPRTVYQFYHPPLHHLISAIWLRINTLLGFSLEGATENLQVLSLFYSMMLILVFDGILKNIKMNDKIRVIAISSVAFFPYLITIAAAINNDGLVTLLMLITISYTISWYYKPSLSTINKIAISIGLSMMTKLSGGLIAPAIAVVFIYKFFESKKVNKKYIKQFFSFGIISLPLGMWWYVRNRIWFGVPFTYILRPEMGPQYIGNYSKVQRLFQITINQLKSLNICFDNSDAFGDYNIFLSLIKFATFNESSYYVSNIISRSIGTILFVIILIFAVACILGLIIGLIKGKLENKIKLFFTVNILIILVNYIQFCFDFPFICTMNIRYILIPILLMIIISAYALERCNNMFKNVITGFMGTYTCFSILSILIWVIVR